jgi:hypothetical protein
MTTTVDLTPQPVDIRFTRSDSLTFSLTVTDVEGDPFFIVGVLSAQARKTFADENAVDFTITSQGNVVTLSLSAEDTADMQGRWLWDAQFEDDGEVRTFARGTLTVTPEVTRA